MPNGTFPYNAFTAAERRVLTEALRTHAALLASFAIGQDASEEAENAKLDAAIALSLAESFEEVQA